MQLDKPKFMDSEYFVADFNNWHLLDDAPKELQDEFNEYIKRLNQEPLQK